MTSPLGISDHHQTNVLNYIRFARYQRGQRLRGVDACFTEVKETRLADETTFTIDEVNDILDRLQTSIRTEVESELINTAHTNVLLLRQVFIQAEKWHLKLAADIGELENRELLDHIREFEEREFAGVKDADLKRTLQPLNETGGTALLKMEIERLEDDNQALAMRLRQVEEQALNFAREKTKLMSEIDRLAGKGAASKLVSGGAGDVQSLEKELSRLRGDLDNARSFGTAGMEGNLAGTKHELLRIRAMLELAERELEQKVSETTPFKNLKNIVQKKNEQLKDLRRRLGKYEEVE